MVASRVEELDRAIDAVVAKLEGTCSNESPEELLHELVSNLTEKELLAALYEIDNEIFNCVQCGWWFETCEHAEGDHDETICANCVEE